MKLTYVPKVELTEEEKNALKLTEKVLHDICKESYCNSEDCIFRSLCGKEFDPMETMEEVNKLLIGES